MTTGIFSLSIEPLEGRAFQHGFHLGTEEQIARQFAREIWTREHRQRGCRTVALIREGRIFDVWDGRDWANAMTDRAFEEWAAEEEAKYK